MKKRPKISLNIALTFLLLFFHCVVPHNIYGAQSDKKPSSNIDITSSDFKRLSNSEKLKLMEKLDGEQKALLFKSLNDLDKTSIFESLDDVEKQDVFKNLDDTDKINFFKNLSEIDKQNVFANLSEADKQKLFKGLSKTEQERLLNALEDEDKKLILESLSPIEKNEWLRKNPALREFLDSEEISEEQFEEEETPSNIEEIMSGQFPTDLLRDLEQYGYDFFGEEVPAFTPVKNVPVGTDYIIGPGDEIKILMWGRLDESYNLEVDNEGILNLPKIGSLTVAGLSFGELKKLIKRKVEAITGVNTNVSMGRLRTIDIFVVGEAKHPATYSVSSLSTVISALYIAGGPSKNGSLRNIHVFRNGEVVANLDLYDFFIKGMKKNDIRLQTGDTIFIPILGPVVGVAGAVRRPAIYEANGTKTIGEAIMLAGGMLPTGELKNIVVERIEGHQRRVIKSFNLDPSNAARDTNLTTSINDFDIIKVYPIHERIRQVVYLEGHVKYPREYELKSGMRLLDIIPSYESLLPEPYLPQAEIIRLMPPDLHPEIIEFNLGALMSGDNSQNRLLQDQDRILIFDAWEKKDIPEVSIEGAIRNPGKYRLYKGMTIKDLIFQAGNMKNIAHSEKASVARIVLGPYETDIQELEFSPRKALDGLAPDNMTLKKDDCVRIREIPQYSKALERKVYLEGEFVFPGEYSFSEGDRLLSVIQKAGGLTEQAYPFGAKFFRESAKEIQEQRMKDYISKLEEDILTIGSQQAGAALDKDKTAILEEALNSRKKLLEKLKGAQLTGRMVINLPEVLADPTSTSNFELRSGDSLVVAVRPDNINVMGEVYNPTAIYAEKNKTIGYYLKSVGGANPDGDEDQIYVVKANGTVISKTQESFFGMIRWDTDNDRWALGFETIKLDPGDTIVVPKKIEVVPWLRVTKDLTTILYQIAVGAGVIIAAF